MDNNGHNKDKGAKGCGHGCGCAPKSTSDTASKKPQASDSEARAKHSHDDCCGHDHHDHHDHDDNCHHDHHHAHHDHDDHGDDDDVAAFPFFAAPAPLDQDNQPVIKKHKGLVLPPVIGHRGACGYAPENTLDSIRTAAEMGVEWIEFDVKLTADSVTILFHDDTLDRTTNGHGPVAQAKLDDLRDLDAGNWFAEGFAGAGIPTFEEALDVILETHLCINVEIKPCPGREIETAEAVLDVLSRVWDEPDRVIISSFSEVCLEVAKDMAPEWPRAYLIDEVPEYWRDMARHLDVRTININGNRPETTQAFIEEILDEGYGVLCYTINDPQKARQLVSWGVDGVFTDVPDVISEVLITKH